MPIATDLEALTHDYGREIFARVGRQGPFLFSPAWWDERLMEWTMGDPAIKVQLFRFIDALPLLRLPAWLRLGLHWMPRDGFLGGLVAKTAYRNAERLARRFIAGSNIEEALKAVARMRRRSLAF